MFRINRSTIDFEISKSDSKKNKGWKNKIIDDATKLSLANFIEIISRYSVYEMGHWCNNNDRWIKNQANKNSTGYNRGVIVYLDLGANNFKYEPSYPHTCVVLAEKYDSIWIVPCSTKKFGKGYPEIIDAYPTDGFKKNTGIQVDSCRWVHKNRVISNVGRISNTKLKEIEKHIIGYLSVYKEDNYNLNKRIKELEDEIVEYKVSEFIEVMQN